MPNRDELIAELLTWSKTGEGQSLVVQFVEQHGKYNVNMGTGTGNEIGDRLSALDTDVLLEIRDLLRSQFTPVPLEINWQQDSRKLLKKRLQLTTNPITRGEDIAYRVEQVYVPLGLVERKKVPRRKRDVFPEHGSELYREGQEQGKKGQDQEKDLQDEVEVTQRFEHEQFLEQVLQQGQSPKSQGKRVAIIGEPGAGKTTLLQQIASWVAENFSEAIVIWISLADLQLDTLETYLEKRWLQRIIREAGGADVSVADKQQFGAQFKQGRVWLLLDGLDEMQVSGNPLSEIQRQLQEGGWLQQARVILTCRLNLWDGNRNSLEQFDTYRTLEFSYPEQVEQFIGQWFAPRRRADLGQALCTALKESGRERIRDLVRNPLRLTLLCFSWYLQQGQLPETQAELYQRFVDRIYEWKQEQFPTTLEERERLNQALAKLSLAVIDTDSQQQTRFRLRQEFVHRFLPGALFDRALKVGWLNQVGVDADNPTQAVYAFYHPTFEEYFAALGIDNERFFLNPGLINPIAETASYRVFEPQWRQVFLLWLGRKDDSLKPKKEALIQSLMTFKDRCGGFYSDRAFLLAAAGIAEFKDCTYGDEIVNELVRWKFGDSNWLHPPGIVLINPAFWLRTLGTLGSILMTSAWIDFAIAHPQSQDLVVLTLVFASYALGLTADSIDSSLQIHLKAAAKEDWAETAFSTTDIQRMIWTLVGLLETTRNESTRIKAVETLGTIGTGNETTIGALVHLLETTQDEDTCRRAAYSLGRISPGNETAIGALVRLLETTQDENTCWRVAASLRDIGMGSERAIGELVRVLETATNEFTRREAIESLSKIGVGNVRMIGELVQVLETTTNEFARREAIESLGKIGPGNETAIGALMRVLETTTDEVTRRIAAYSLSKIDPGSETAIGALVQVLETTTNEVTCREVIGSLGEISSGNETAIGALMRVLETTTNEVTRRRSAESLGKIGPGNETAIGALVRLLETVEDEYTRRRAVETLGKISPGNETAIGALVRLLETTQDEDTCREAIESLGKIGPGNETAIGALMRVLETTTDEFTCRKAVLNGGIILRLVGRVFRAFSHRFIPWNNNAQKVARMITANSLVIIGTGNKTMNRALVRSLRHNLRSKEAYQLMMKCAEMMPYKDFFQAFHSTRWFF